MKAFPAGFVQSPTEVEGGYVQFNIMPPFETPVGAHTFRVDAEMSWDGGHVETGLDVLWYPTRGETPLNPGNTK